MQGGKAKRTWRKEKQSLGRAAALGGGGFCGPLSVQLRVCIVD